MSAYPSDPRGRLTRLSDVCGRVLTGWDDDRILAAFVYGSVLSERWRPDSDVDIAILDCAEQRLSWEQEAKLMDALERATGRGIDLRLLRDCSLSHQAHVLTEGCRIWVREAAAVEKYSECVLAAFREQHDRISVQWLALIDRLACKADVRK